MDKHKCCGSVLKGVSHDFPRVHGASREAPEEYILISDQFVFAVEVEHLEDFPLEIAHGVKKIIENRLQSGEGAPNDFK